MRQSLRNANNAALIEMASHHSQLFEKLDVRSNEDCSIISNIVLACVPSVEYLNKVVSDRPCASRFRRRLLL